MALEGVEASTARMTLFFHLRASSPNGKHTPIGGVTLPLQTSQYSDTHLAVTHSIRESRSAVVRGLARASGCAEVYWSRKRGRVIRHGRGRLDLRRRTALHVFAGKFTNT